MGIYHISECPLKLGCLGGMGQGSRESIQFIGMRINKQKFKVNSLLVSEPSDDDNQFLDDFLKPPQKEKQSSHKFHQNQSTVQLHHNSVPSRLPKKHQEGLQTLQQTQVNKQIQHILKTIKKQEQIRRERTRQFLQKVALQREEEKRVHEFKIAERRIKKRLMLMERKEHLQEELLSFAHSKFEDTEPVRHIKEKAKSVDDVARQEEKAVVRRNATPILAPTKPIQIRRQGSTQPRRRELLAHASIGREKVQLASTENFLPEISNGSAVDLRGNRVSRISTITLTKELRIQEERGKPKVRERDYLGELKAVKRRNYTEANSELEKLYEAGEVSREKTERAVELVSKLENKRKLRLRNPNEMDYKQAQRKLQLLSFLHRQHP